MKTITITTNLEVTVRTQQPITSIVRRETIKKMFFHRVIEDNFLRNKFDFHRYKVIPRLRKTYKGLTFRGNEA